MLLVSANIYYISMLVYHRQKLVTTYFCEFLKMLPLAKVLVSI